MAPPVGVAGAPSRHRLAREAEVLLWVAQGKSNPDIAGILGCAENTVKVHLARIFEKLGVENRNAASMYAVDTLLRYAKEKTSPRVAL